MNIFRTHSARPECSSETRRKNPPIIIQLCLIVLSTMPIASSTQAQTTGALDEVQNYTNRGASTRTEIQFLDFLASANAPKRAGFSLMPPNSAFSVNANRLNTTADSPPAVHGSGTVGKIPIWIDVRPNGESIIGDSIITQLSGNIGIGLDTPNSKLSVQGTIETTLGGYKFPDGTIQTTAAVSGLQVVLHDQTLQGTGTAASPLKVAIPLTLTTQSHFLIPILKVGAFGGGVAVEANGGIAIHALGSRAAGTDDPGIGVSAEGAGGTDKGGGSGLVTKGGDSLGAGEKIGGFGMEAFGGNADNGGGGDAVSAVAGNGQLGGDGVRAVGGNSLSLIGGNGVRANGGDSLNSGGGHGVVATGGAGNGPGHLGGIGIVATHGTGTGGATDGDAGLFIGNVSISGDLSVSGTKNFRIDHPLDPEHKYLYHAAIESAEVLNIYSGNIRLDAHGEAIVKLPEWFEAINKDIRYSLTSVGAPGQGLYIAEEVSHNQFKIAGGMPGSKVSWQVTGIRSDSTTRLHPFKLEEEKPKRGAQRLP